MAKMEETMTKPDKNVQDAPERPEISRHAVILFRDGRALAANQAPGMSQKQSYLT